MTTPFVFFISDVWKNEKVDPARGKPQLSTSSSVVALLLPLALLEETGIHVG
jgi:hypothetical protein